MYFQPGRHDGGVCVREGDNSLCSCEGEVGEGLSLSGKRVPGRKPVPGAALAPAQLCYSCSCSPLLRGVLEEAETVTARARGGQGWGNRAQLK